MAKLIKKKKNITTTQNMSERTEPPQLHVAGQEPQDISAPTPDVSTSSSGEKTTSPSGAQDSPQVVTPSDVAAAASKPEMTRIAFTEILIPPPRVGRYSFASEFGISSVKPNDQFLVPRSVADHLVVCSKAVRITY